MTSEDVTMFRKQLILNLFQKRDVYFCAALSFRFYFLSSSLGRENNFSRMNFCPLSVFFVVIIILFVFFINHGLLRRRVERDKIRFE